MRKCVLENGRVSLHTLVGCPPSIFQRIGTVLETAKSWLAGTTANAEFHATLRDADTYLRGLDLDAAEYPTQHPEWRQLAEAYRHACLLRVMRWPDTFAVPCSDAGVRASVAAILDARANIAASSPFSKRMLFPLFLAAADTTVPHQLHYAAMSINEIRRSTGFEHPAMKTVLERVWEERRSNTRGWRNVPWMEFVSRSSTAFPIRPPVHWSTAMAVANLRAAFRRVLKACRSNTRISSSDRGEIGDLMACHAHVSLTSGKLI